MLERLKDALAAFPDHFVSAAKLPALLQVLRRIHEDYRQRGEEPKAS
jgi:hypothetical protein